MRNTNVLDFMMTLDENYTIISIYPNDSKFNDFVNMEIESIVNKSSTDQIKTFINNLDIHNSSFHYQIKLTHHKQTYSCQFNGYKDDKKSIVFALFNSTTDDDVLKKMMRLNNLQVNELRALQKKFQMQDVNVYEEISKLNSELLNSKRIIEKQNAELQRYNNLLKKMSIEDTLTGSYNRRYFYEYMKENILSSQKDLNHSLIMIDFNDFKMVNDQFGHDAGDRLLINFVKQTKDIVKGKGEVFRIGGDEFIIIINQTNPKEVSSYIKAIETKFSSNSPIASLAFGHIIFNESQINHDFDLSNLVNQTDSLMYENKRKQKSK